MIHYYTERREPRHHPHSDNRALRLPPHQPLRCPGPKEGRPTTTTLPVPLPVLFCILPPMLKNPGGCRILRERTGRAGRGRETVGTCGMRRDPRDREIRIKQPVARKSRNPSPGGTRAEPGRGGLGREGRGLSREKAGWAGNIAGKAGIQTGRSENCPGGLKMKLGKGLRKSSFFGRFHPSPFCLCA
ncbi:hypothetical protein R1sor_024816 [Riccia sorocarpa]|uniref:Uncharacterized protein n=1 Tax=Riccia sorocarpa TaxID=122646 RepID=A0ABD3GUQ4_9MARC